MNIVDTNIGLSSFLKILKSDDIILVPIFVDENKHFSINKLCLLYISDFVNNDALLCYDHPECNNLNETSYELLSNYLKNKNIFVINKKINLSFINDKNTYDVSLLEFLGYGAIKTNFYEHTSAHKVLYKNFNNIENFNRFIPLVKWIEYFTELNIKINNIINQYQYLFKDESYNNYNNIFYESFRKLESAGIHVSNNFKNKEYVYNELIYSQYNFYTKTGRPTCNGANINLLGINKSDGSRSFYNSRFGNDGVMLLVDYKSRHLYLIADILNETFTENPHTYLGKIYTGKDKLTDEEYNESKKITYQLLYGNIPKEFETIPLFNKINIFISELYNAYNNDGFIISPIFKRKLLKSSLGELKKQTIFNYYLQCMETEYGINTMMKILNLLENFETKCILYIYDSFLFDFKLSDGKELLNVLFNIINNDNKFPITIEYGKNYHTLQQVFID